MTKKKTKEKPKSKYRFSPWLLLLVVALIVGTVTVGLTNLSERRIAAVQQEDIASPSPTSTSTEPELTEQRIIAFESAWIQVDAKKRRAAMKQYVGEPYFNSQPLQNGQTPEDKAALKLTRTLDTDRSKFEQTSGGTGVINVDAQLVVVRKDAKKRPKKPLTIRHSTTWVYHTDTKQWIVELDRPSSR